MSETSPAISAKIPYRPLMVQVLGELLQKYQGLSGYEVAVKLLVDEKLLILKQEESLIKMEKFSA